MFRLGRLDRFDLIALLISLAAVIASAGVTFRIFDAIPHLEDEVAYSWQARALAEGHLWVASPPDPQSMLIPFVIDFNGKRFGKYPPGWPLLLAVGERLGGRWLVNPLLGGLGIWLTYLLGKRTLNPRAGLVAAGLTLTSPFFLMNSGSLLSHPLGLVLASGFALLWVINFGELKGSRRWSYTLLAAALLGYLVLTRPFTALAIAVPFAFHGLILFVKSDRSTRLHLIGMGLVVIGLSALLSAWQYAVTGNPLLNPYQLWWPYDKVGFGPGYGVTPQGHTLDQAIYNTQVSLQVGWQDLFGWAGISWLFLPFGAWAAHKNGRALLLFTAFPFLVLFYLAYWIGSYLFGPRYFYEGLFSLTLATAAGISWLVGWELEPFSAAGESLTTKMPKPWLPAAEKLLGVWKKIRGYVIPALIAALVVYNLVFFLPKRLESMTGLYTIKGANLAPFLSPRGKALTPALVIIHSDLWMGYGNMLDLENPELTTPWIFSWSRSPQLDSALPQLYPDRSVYHYYVNNPGVFYTNPKP